MAVSLQLFYHNRTRLKRLNPLAIADLVHRDYVPQGRITLAQFAVMLRETVELRLVS